MSKKPPFVSTVMSTLSSKGNTSSAEGKSREGTVKKYKGKSLEELRMEDYTANRKGPQSAAGDVVKSEGTLEPSEIHAMCERIRKLEIQQKALTEENAFMKRQIDVCMYRTNPVAYGNQMPPSYSWPLSPTQYPPSVVQTTSNDTPGKSSDGSSKDNRMLIAVNNTPGSLSVVPSKGLNTSLGQSKPFANMESTPRSQRTSTPRVMVYGQAENADPLPTVQIHRWLFVTRFARSVTNDQISDYMSRKLSSKRRPVCIPLTRPEEPLNKVASFRLGLFPEEFDEAMAPNFWDKGVLVSEFKFPTKSKTPRSRSLAKKLDASF